MQISDTKSYLKEKLANLWKRDFNFQLTLSLAFKKELKN